MYRGVCGVEKTLAKVVVVFNVKPQNTVPEVIAFPRYNMKCSGENVILRGIFRDVSRFPQHFML